MLDGPFAETPSSPAAPLTFVPPSMFGPPEYIHADMQDTSVPALLEFAGGKAVWLPWNLGTLYYRHSLPAHAGLFRDVVSGLLGGKRQVRTSAHPLVEISWMKQGSRRQLHLVNLAGHSQTGYFDPPPFRDVTFDVEGEYAQAHAVRANTGLRIERRGGRTRFTLPRLDDYELIALE